MYYKVILTFITIISIYMIFPTAYNRLINPNIIRSFNSDKIYLTFDDGPDADYTNELLDILDKYNIKASFFLVANKAKKEEVIVKRIINEGHSIGLHSLSHKNSWFLTPRQMNRDFIQSLDILNAFNYPLCFYRPPWGIFNLFTNRFAGTNNLKTILWTIISRDWNEKTPVDYIVNNIAQNVKPGDILLLHDSGGDKYAPRNTLLALDILIPILLEEGYIFDTI